MPLTLIVLLFIGSVFISRPKLKSRLTLAGLILLLINTNSAITNTIFKWWEIPAEPLSSFNSANPMVGIVLTGVADLDKTPRDRVYLSAGASRVTHAIQLYKRGILKKIVISGGSGDPYQQEIKEANELIKVFTMCQVPEKDLIIEPNSRNTFESAAAVAGILNSQLPDSQYLLITSAFHMRRSLGVFKKAGIPVQPFSTDFRTSDPPLTWKQILIPSPGALKRMHILCKELLGIFAYKIAGYL